MVQPGEVEGTDCGLRPPTKQAQRLQKPSQPVVDGDGLVQLVIGDDVAGEALEYLLQRRQPVSVVVEFVLILAVVGNAELEDLHHLVVLPHVADLLQVLAGDRHYHQVQRGVEGIGSQQCFSELGAGEGADHVGHEREGLFRRPGVTAVAEAERDRSRRVDELIGHEAAGEVAHDLFAAAAGFCQRLQPRLHQCAYLSDLHVWSSFDCGRRPVYQPAVRPPSTARH